jgi:hypothetical protein
VASTVKWGTIFGVSELQAAPPCRSGDVVGSAGRKKKKAWLAPPPAAHGTPSKHRSRSHDDSSLSLRHREASGITPDGGIERVGLEAQMANTPGWRGRRTLKALLVLCLLGALLAIVFSIATTAKNLTGS